MTEYFVVLTSLFLINDILYVHTGKKTVITVILALTTTNRVIEQSTMILFQKMFLTYYV